MSKGRVVKAFVVAAAAASLLTCGMSGSASADGYGSPITWRSALGGWLWADQNGGSLNVISEPFQWYDSENSDGTWNEVDVYGHCLAAYGRNVVTENCNPTPNHTSANERWHEHFQGSGQGWNLISATTGYYLDETGSDTWGSVYAHDGNANNNNERWF
ncbi:hypothetical protein ACIGXM_25620 [Kitasatospora sp. NPDC052896]|uniref:hypothetical protein n=1 Tax=Kitasatospora sp. NPDC052896 TaxID=3364061 RepID=UPI0037C8536D